MRETQIVNLEQDVLGLNVGGWILYVEILKTWKVVRSGKSRNEIELL